MQIIIKKRTLPIFSRIIFLQYFQIIKSIAKIVKKLSKVNNNKITKSNYIIFFLLLYHFNFRTLKKVHPKLYKIAVISTHAKCLMYCYEFMNSG